MNGAVGRQFYIGTCGYSYPGAPPNGWHGVFYPKGVGKGAEPLEFYARYFNSVEINSTTALNQERGASGNKALGGSRRLVYDDA